MFKFTYEAMELSFKKFIRILRHTVQKLSSEIKLTKVWMVLISNWKVDSNEPKYVFLIPKYKSYKGSNFHWLMTQNNLGI